MGHNKSFKPYRQASGAAATHTRPQPARWTIALAFLAAVLAILILVAGDYTLAVLETLLYAAFPLTLLIAAAFLGLTLSVPLARRGLFSTAPWPDAWRLLISIALGLGALGLLTLLAGSLGLVGSRWFAPALLLAATTAGFIPTRAFFAAFDWSPLTAPARRIDWLILLAAPPIAMLLLAATYPPGTLWLSEGRGYDVLEYHLQLPREYIAAGATAPVPHNVYSFFPSHVEMLYLLLMQLAQLGLHSSDHVKGIFPAQFLHAALMLLSAAALGLSPLRLRPLGRTLAVILFLATPWTIVCGSLAYNEAGVLLFGAIALALAVGGPRNSAATITIGILLGLAVGCKLTAGVFLAAPVGLLLLLTARWRSLLTAAAIALLIFAPWALRAAIASGGNPIFPLAANLLGRDGWTPDQVDRFNRGHAPPPAQQSLTARLAALAPELLLHPQWSPGIADFQNWTNPQPAYAAKRPDLPWPNRFGLLWLILPVAILLALIPGTNRPPGTVSAAWLLALVLALQVLAWLFLTHLQSRFLLPCLLPLCWLAGLAIDAPRPGLATIIRVLICIFVGLQAAAALFLLIPESGLFHGSLRRDPATGEPALQYIGVLPPDADAAKTIYFLGDATPLYDRGRILYNTVFDTNPLAEELRARGPAAAAAFLAAHHVDQLRVNLAEIERARRTYGYDPAITPDSIAAIIRAGQMLPAPSAPGTEVWDLPNNDRR